MIVIPSLEILGGRVVAPDDDTVLAEDPIAAARAMRDDGALFFQLVDLDAIRQSGDNLALIESFVEAGLPCQVAGGVRDLDCAQRLVDLGVDRFLVGSMLHASADDARQCAERFAARAVAAVDVEDGKAAIRGGPQGIGGSVAEAATQVAAMGFARVMLTSFDGGVPRVGPDLEAIGAALDAGIEVLANIVARDRSDLVSLKPLIERGLGGVVLSTACRTLDAVMR